MVLNLTPDKQHTAVVNQIMPLMKKDACLSYSHGFNIVEEGMKIREDLTVIMVAPKCPGTEVREEYKRGFGVSRFTLKMTPGATAWNWPRPMQRAPVGTVPAYCSPHSLPRSSQT